MKMYNYVQEYVAIHCNNANYHQVPKNKYLKREDEMVLKKYFLDALEGYFCWEKAFAIWVKWGNPYLPNVPFLYPWKGMEIKHWAKVDA